MRITQQKKPEKELVNGLTSTNMKEPTNHLKEKHRNKYI